MQKIPLFKKNICQNFPFATIVDPKLTLCYCALLFTSDLALAWAIDLIELTANASVNKIEFIDSNRAHK